MTTRGSAPSALPTGTLAGGNKDGTKRHRAAINLLVSAAAASVCAVVVVGGPTTAALAADPPVCGPAVPISSSNNSSSPLSLTVPQYSGPGTLQSASISIEVTANSFQNEFLNPTTFQPGLGDATAAYIGEAQVLQASGPGLGALADVASPGIAYGGSGPNSFTVGTAQPALPSGVAATEALGAAGTSTAPAAPSTWAALGFPFVANAVAPVSASGSLNYATAPNQAAAVPAASLGSYEGPGNVSLTAIDDDEQTQTATTSWLVGGTVTTTIEACALYVALPAALPEAPMVALIPIAALAAGGGLLFARRRRTA